MVSRMELNQSQVEELEALGCKDLYRTAQIDAVLALMIESQS